MNPYIILFTLKNNKILNKLSSPARAIYNKLLEKQLHRHPLRRANKLHLAYFGKRLNLDNPTTLFDKIMLLEYGSDVSVMRRLTDKAAARDFVKERGMGHLLNDVYHILDKMPTFEEFTALLPDKCVVKTNNSGGGEAVIIIRDKKKDDLGKIYKKLKAAFSDNYGERTGQPHYMGIEPKIIIERLLENDKRPGGPIDDFKFMCINGEPMAINALAERNLNTHSVLDQYYDLNMNRFDWAPQNSQRLIDKPASLKEMEEAARVLAQGFPFVRVDFYESEGHPVFSEMTFTPGFDFFVGSFGEENLHWGERMDISKVKIDRSRITPDLF